MGELALCWLTLIGAAVAILERTHFALAVLTRRFPPQRQRLVERINHLLIAVFGGFVAVYGPFHSKIEKWRTRVSAPHESEHLIRR